MTGYTVHTGASKKFVSGWDKVFGETADSKSAGSKSKDKAAAKGEKTRPKKGRKSRNP